VRFAAGEANVVGAKESGFIQQTRQQLWREIHLLIGEAAQAVLAVQVAAGGDDEGDAGEQHGGK
jgi:hypothetical protein